MTRPPTTGQCDTRLTLQEDVGAARASSGRHVEDWRDYVTVWASVDPVGGQEVSPASQVEGQVTHDVWFRYGTHTQRLTSAMRGVFGGRVIHFTAVQRHNERGFWWHCTGTESPDQTAVSVGRYADQDYAC